MTSQTRVLIVDDSFVFRRLLKETLGRHKGIMIVGTAANGREAVTQIPTLRPDLLVLDVEMPEMDGLATLDEIRARRLDVGAIMFSTLTSKGADTTLDALAKGAFDFVPKPANTGAFAESVARIERELIPKIEAYGAMRNGGPRPSVLRVPAGPRTAAPLRPSPRPCPRPVPQPGARAAFRPAFPPEAVGIGVSTGGPNALNSVIPKFPAGFPLPVFLVQHMPPVFTAQLARRLDEKSALRVVEAADGMAVEGGTVYVAPGDYHMVAALDGTRRVVRLTQSPPVNSCRPAVDVLYESLAQVYGGRVVAAILTGMGQDGLAGCRALKSKGASVIAQDKETCVVWGMPRFVTEAGIADRVVSLECVTDSILDAVRAGGRWR